MPQVSNEVRAVLAEATIGAEGVKLNGTLDRPLYQAVDKVLKAAGGKWNRKAGLHVFDGDPTDFLQPIIDTGEYRNLRSDLGQFDTPDALAADLVATADIRQGMLCLEPSIGVGNLAAAMIAAGGFVDGCEVDMGRVRTLVERGILPSDRILVADFLDTTPHPIYDRVVMNPPFAKKEDMRHVLHALKFLKPGGKLVSVMAAGVTFRTDMETSSFLATISRLGGSIEELPENSFKSSGTGVRTCVVRVSVPEV